MAFFSSPQWVGWLPVTVNMHVLVVEPCWWIVPLCNLDWFILVDDRNNVKTVCTTVRIIVLRNRVKVAVCQFVVHKNPVVVRCYFDVNHSTNFSVVCGKKSNVVWLGNIQDFELVVRGNVSITSTRPVRVFDTVFHEITFNGNLRRVAGSWSNIFVFRIAWAACDVVKFGRWGNITIAIEIVIVNQLHVISLQTMRQQI